MNFFYFELKEVHKFFMGKFLDETGLSSVINKIKTYIDKNKVSVDTSLSSTSTNPVQNKVISNTLSSYAKTSDLVAYASANDVKLNYVTKDYLSTALSSINTFDSSNYYTKNDFNKLSYIQFPITYNGIIYETGNLLRKNTICTYYNNIVNTTYSSPLYNATKIRELSISSSGITLLHDSNSYKLYATDGTIFDINPLISTYLSLDMGKIKLKNLRNINNSIVNGEENIIINDPGITLSNDYNNYITYINSSYIETPSIVSDNVTTINIETEYITISDGLILKNGSIVDNTGFHSVLASEVSYLTVKSNGLYLVSNSYFGDGKTTCDLIMVHSYKGTKLIDNSCATIETGSNYIRFTASKGAITVYKIMC